MPDESNDRPAFSFPANFFRCRSLHADYGIDAVASLENALSLLLASTAVET
jgi:hypothetical protein